METKPDCRATGHSCACAPRQREFRVVFNLATTPPRPRFLAALRAVWRWWLLQARSAAFRDQLRAKFAVVAIQNTRVEKMFVSPAMLESFRRYLGDQLTPRVGRDEGRVKLVGMLWGAEVWVESDRPADAISFECVIRRNTNPAA